MTVTTLRQYFNANVEYAGIAFYDPAIKATKVKAGQRLDSVIRIDRPLVTIEENGWMLQGRDKRQIIDQQSFEDHVSAFTKIERHNLMSQERIDFTQCAQISRVERGDQLKHPVITGSAYYGLGTHAPVPGFDVRFFSNDEKSFFSELDFWSNFADGACFEKEGQAFYRSNNVGEDDIVEYIPLTQTTRFTSDGGERTFNSDFSVCREGTKDSSGDLFLMRNTCFDQLHHIQRKHKALKI